MFRDTTASRAPPGCPALGFFASLGGVAIIGFSRFAFPFFYGVFVKISLGKSGTLFCLQIPKYLIKILDNSICKRVSYPMSMLSMLRSRPAFLLLTSLLCWSGVEMPAAHAQDAVGAQQISNAISMATKEEIQSMEAFNQSLIDSVDSMAKDIKANRILIEDKERAREATSAADGRLST